MCRQCHSGHAVKADRHFTDRLGRIDVERNTYFSGHLGSFRDWLHHTSFVICGHQAYQASVCGNVLGKYGYTA
jgi:hypothetical protein